MLVSMIVIYITVQSAAPYGTEALVEREYIFYCLLPEGFHKPLHKYGQQDLK